MSQYLASSNREKIRHKDNHKPSLQQRSSSSASIHSVSSTSSKVSEATNNLKRRISGLSIKRIVSRTPKQEDPPAADPELQTPVQAAEAPPLGQSDTIATLLSAATTMVPADGAEAADAAEPDQRQEQKPESHPVLSTPLSETETAQHETNFIDKDKSPVFIGTTFATTSSSSFPTPKITPEMSAAAPKETPMHKKGHDDAKSLVALVADAVGRAAVTGQQVVTAGLNLARDSVYRTSAAVQSGVNKTVAAFQQNRLLTYDALYVAFSAAAATGAYYYHEHLLKSNLTCSHCVNKQVPWEVVAGVSTFVGLFGVGNYLYLKKNGKKY